MADYRYPGSRPFEDTEIDRILFYGREDETQRLLHLVLAERLVVLFAKSGVGKSSLLNAGLFNLLSERGYFPITLSLNKPDNDPIKMIFDQIKEKVKVDADESGIDHPRVKKKHQKTLWQYFKTAEFWSKDDKLLTPVLVFDQFEELFTLGTTETHKEHRKKFIQQLADLVRGTKPKSLQRTSKTGDKSSYSDSAPNVKIIISIREDFLAHLEEMSTKIPGVLQKRFRLTSMTPEQARQAIKEPARLDNEQLATKQFSYNADTIDAIVKFLQKRKEGDRTITSGEIEPFQLQLLCQHIEKMIYEKQKQVVGKTKEQIRVRKEDLGGEPGMQKVLQNFYEDEIKSLTPPPARKAARKLCEAGLISPSGRRLSLDEEMIEKDFGVNKELLTSLSDKRLLRSKPMLGSLYHEISHDTLVAPILNSFRRRQRNKNILVWSGVIVFFVILGGVFYSQRQSKQDVEKLNIALEKTNNLLAQMNDFTAENDSLLKEFIKLKTDLLETTKKVTTYDQIIKPDPERKDLKAFIDEEIEKLKDEKIKEAIDKSIESLANSIITFDSLETRSKSDTVTIRQKFELWKDSFRITDIRRTNANIDAVLDSIARYDSLMERWASITTVDGFVTCDNVNVIKDKKDKLDISPIGDTTKFNPGKVYVWARVNAPEDETLKLVWLNSKGDTLSIVHKSGQERLWASLKVEESNGYRIYYWKNINDVGTYEVRLFNSQKHLIGRRTFEIQHPYITAK